jgi:hypothetical protein
MELCGAVVESTPIDIELFDTDVLNAKAAASACTSSSLHPITIWSRAAEVLFIARHVAVE